jgi:hypothetical protein
MRTRAPGRVATPKEYLYDTRRTGAVPYALEDIVAKERFTMRTNRFCVEIAGSKAVLAAILVAPPWAASNAGVVHPAGVAGAGLEGRRDGVLHDAVAAPVTERSSRKVGAQPWLWGTGTATNSGDAIDFPFLFSGMVWLLLRTERLHGFTQFSGHCFRYFLVVLGCRSGRRQPGQGDIPDVLRHKGAGRVRDRRHDTARARLNCGDLRRQPRAAV